MTESPRQDPLDALIDIAVEIADHGQFASNEAMDCGHDHNDYARRIRAQVAQLCAERAAREHDMDALMTAYEDLEQEILKLNPTWKHPTYYEGPPEDDISY